MPRGGSRDAVAFRKEPRQRVIEVRAPGFGDLLRTLFRVLTFRATGDEIGAFGWRHFALGMICALLAGVGRHWDEPDAPQAVRWGLASAAYVLVFATAMWPFIALLGPDRWEWSKFATFVAFTSPLAWIYAIPVEWWLPQEQAAYVNYGFLALVAIWRVLLLTVYVPRYSGLDRWASFIGWSTPLVVALAVLGGSGVIEAVVNFMAGARNEPPDLAAVKAIGVFAFFYSPLALFLYLYQWWRR